ncbi:MAG TPA: divergent polysaccharide deacetylase family protein [Candidatus Acidoferrales bacterium]|nr:divergent polysaccharide deacetylase family protein [Candidatus Acidoferrales bacterium]
MPASHRGAEFPLRAFFRRISAPAFSFFLIFLAAGCGKRPPSSAEINAITSDLTSAAQKAAGRGAQIVIRPESQPLSGGGSLHIANDIYIRLADASSLSAVDQALARAAARSRLTRASYAHSANAIRFDLLLRGVRIESVRIGAPRSANANQLAPSETGPRLAIIIDDIGADAAAAQTLLKLPVPLTFSVLPDQPHSAEIAEAVFRRGDQVMLHLPMEFEGSTAKPEAVELRVGMNQSEVESILAAMLANVPHAIGVNNHEGSRATADPQLMAELMPALRARNLFFIDSRTTAATVAYDEAEQAGVPAASRNVFLDDVETRGAILGQLDLAVRDAQKQGSAIAIGHPHPATIAALAEELPQLKSRGIQLVFVSTLVR